jgi:cephalosporin-C deacetylase
MGTAGGAVSRPAMGFAVLAIDVRLQGNDTGSKSGAPTGHVDSGMTLGLLDREAYYLRHTYTDACRAVRLAREIPEIDPKRVVVEGGSQGGGLSIAVAGLIPDVALCLADVPSYGWIEKRIFDRSGTFGTVAGVIRRHPDWMEKICTTLSYFDTLNLADRIQCPTLVSVGLKDPVCPADTVYAVYNRIRAPKRIDAYPFGEHDGGGSYHEERKYAFVREKMG